MVAVFRRIDLNEIFQHSLKWTGGHGVAGYRNIKRNAYSGMVWRLFTTKYVAKV